MMSGIGVGMSNGSAAAGMSAGTAPAMSAEQMTALLDETIAALTKLDTTRLEAMAAAVETKVGAGELAAMLLPDRTMWEQELSRITARHRLLGKVLENTGANLRVLEGLNRRNRIGEQTWAR